MFRRVGLPTRYPPEVGHFPSAGGSVSWHICLHPGPEQSVGQAEDEEPRGKTSTVCIIP